jgi:hypothetical protein
MTFASDLCVMSVWSRDGEDLRATGSSIAEPVCRGSAMRDAAIQRAEPEREGAQPEAEGEVHDQDSARRVSAAAAAVRFGRAAPDRQRKAPAASPSLAAAEQQVSSAGRGAHAEAQDHADPARAQRPRRERAAQETSIPAVAGPADEREGRAPATPGPATREGSEPASPRDGAAGPGESVADAFNATRVAHPSAPAFGQVAWNSHEPVASYTAYLDGEDWRFRLTSLALDVPVGVNAGGRTDVPGANHAVVTADTWETIATDLAPAGGAPNRSPRATYWAEDLTWRHESFHFDEFNTFLKASFRSFETTIEGGGYREACREGDTSEDAVARKSADLKARLLAAWNQAKRNMSPGMEDRAYDDGVAEYQARADAVRARAVDEGWS